MFFIVNKVDQQGINPATMDEIITRVETTLRNLLPASKGGRSWIPRDHIIPISAFKGFIRRYF